MILSQISYQKGGNRENVYFTKLYKNLSNLFFDHFCLILFDQNIFLV